MGKVKVKGYIVQCKCDCGEVFEKREDTPDGLINCKKCGQWYLFTAVFDMFNVSVVRCERDGC